MEPGTDGNELARIAELVCLRLTLLSPVAHSATDSEGDFQCEVG